MKRIAVVGMAARYPDAESPRELWENALSGRRPFRRLPNVRMNLDDYWSADPKAPDRFYARNASVIEGWEFDRAGYRIAGSTYRSTDLTHWLALDTAARALADAGFPNAEGMPNERTSVIIGNSLTGEFTRANLMRLRWPYVRRTVGAALKQQGWDDDALAEFLGGLEVSYKAPFPGIDEDTLAGGLANTIAGRICNYFDLKGGGFTVDGACSSSLLSVANSAKALTDGDVDVAIAGGVDLSIDPFEIIGFAKTGALATGEMRVYDKHSNGFWPGEGCGMVVLMREEDAIANNMKIYANVAGYGISSDGKGGITRPEVSGYQLMLRRAYGRAGFGVETVGLFEGHGTGTAVGDKTELTALSQARMNADPSELLPAAIGTIKGMIGHTKAAAGVAGLIKAVMAVHEQVLPPAIGVVEPDEILERQDGALRPLKAAEPWPTSVPLRAGVTAMGFGGINSHIVIEGATSHRTPTFSGRTRALVTSMQDAELILLDGGSKNELRTRLADLAEWITSVSYAQLADVAATAQKQLRGLPYRAAVVVTSPEDAGRRLTKLIETLDAGETSLFSADGRSFLGHSTKRAKLGFLFPGQGSGKGTSGGALRRRFAEVDEVYRTANLPTSGDMVATEVAQPRIVTGSMAGLRALSMFNLEATTAVGHSLGEISALHWAGVLTEAETLTVAANRGRAMSEFSASGSMAGMATDPDAVRTLIGDLPVVIAGYNGPGQTVVAGTLEALQTLGERAAEAKVGFTKLRVSHAFHSPLVAPAADSFAASLEGVTFAPVGKRIVSTVSGELLGPDTDVPALLHRQIVDPVQFSQALELAAKDIDLFIEVGPGSVLSGLAPAVAGVPAVAMDTDDESLRGLLGALGAAFAVGAPLMHEELFRGRITKPLEIGATFSFFESPAEAAPTLVPMAKINVTGDAGGVATAVPTLPSPSKPVDPTPAGGSVTEESTIELLRRMVAERVELPVHMVPDDSLLLDDLHLSSITVGGVVNEAVGLLGLNVAQAPTNFATATLAELAQLLDTLLAEGGSAAPANEVVAGAASWSRPYSLDLDEIPLRPAPPDPQAVSGPWTLFAVPGGIGEPLLEALQTAGVGSGVLVCLPEDVTADQVELALDGAHTVLDGRHGDRFVLVQAGDRGAAGLAKTLRQEHPRLKVTIVTTPLSTESTDSTAIIDRVVAEVRATTSYADVNYDAEGVRRLPTLRAMPVTPARANKPLGPGDVLLVTGGGKGITAECARVVAEETGTALALLGRSDPARDDELASNLERLAVAGITARYFATDVTDAEAVRRTVEQVEEELGTVTGFLHGSGVNQPAAVTSLTMAEFDQTFAPKVGGYQAVLDAIDPAGLKLLVTFGSIIGRAGLAGEAHYATANEWLAAATAEFAREHPDCRTVCMEWSVWSGVGMGEKLSVVESLARDGITPVTSEDGLVIMRRLVNDQDTPPIVVISGRTGRIDTVRHAPLDLPMGRFLERPLISYAGVELVTEVDLSAGADLYLPDHFLDGNLLFPAVFGMEAMSQVAAAAAGRSDVPVVENAEFLRPIVVPPGGSTTVRVAAVVVDNDVVEATIRSADTAFSADHFRARLRFGADAPAAGAPEQISDELPDVVLDPHTELYGDVLFQGGRFQRLKTYHRSAARHVDVDVVARPDQWFAAYLPGDLLLGDPGVRDTLMHGNQVCVPDATLLPVRIDRMHPGGDKLAAADKLRFTATERFRDGDRYVYDVAVRDGAGEVLERWEGLHLQAVRKTDAKGPWAPVLLGSYLERALGDLLGASVAVVVEPHDADDRPEDRRRYTALAASRAFGEKVTIRYRADGKPELENGQTLSASHGPRVTLAVTAEGTLGCDVESAAERSPQEWAGLLGRHQPLADLIASELSESLDVAATRVWSATECLQKAGVSTDTPLTTETSPRSGWAVLSAGPLRIATFATCLSGDSVPVVFAILVEGRS
jgi:enediyne polyketide synthase